ncbi:MAG TPA: CBS domain-containing protein [Myxococcota bacterium]|nr:CBS domain-containing protein [Myxococcota bacterium]
MVSVRRVMKRKVVRISADDTLWIVKEIMDLAHVRHLPVVNRGELVGVVSQRDLLRASLSNVMGISAEEQKIFLEGVKIAEVMSTPPRTIGADESVQAAARAMAEYKIGCLPVVDGKEIVGIVTETDLLHYFASMPER